MRKVLRPEEAAEMIPDGASLLIGGFMGVGGPMRMMNALVARGVRDLTIIANDSGHKGIGIGALVAAGAVRKIVTSHIGLNPETQAKMIAGEIEVELVPQGTLIERIRAGGFGLGGVLTPTGVGTEVENGKQVIEVDGKRFLLEKPIKADFALVRAWRADYIGNLSYAFTARNFNPTIAMAGKVVIAEPESIVPTGAIAPDDVHTPGAIVDHLLTRGA